LPVASPSSAPPTPTFGEALRFWLKLGFVSFGGPAGQIAIMHRELVDRLRWISERRFLHALNYCMVLPGPEATQLAIYIGWLLHRVRGGIAAGMLFVLPSLVLLIALSWIYVRFGKVPAIAAVLYGVKPAVVAIVLAAAWRIGTRALHHPVLWAIAIAAFVALFAGDVPFPFVIAGAAAIGWFGGRAAPRAFALTAHDAATHTSAAPSVIDDDTPTPAHARYSHGRLLGMIAAFLALWIAGVAALLALQGWRGDLTQMAWFFTKAALVTFGGAYAVLPYVIQGAVEDYGWLTAPQMIDGLALGESTPGPLIMIVTFVGFLGGWNKHALGGALAAGGAAGAIVTTFFTFLPSFLFILAGGPLVERTRDDVKLTAPLTAITAAVVGVIVNLAVYFAMHVLWPHATASSPLSGGFDWPAGVIAAVAAVLLVTKKAGVIPVIVASGLAGLALWAAGLHAAT
jgi:chromate transporter